MRPSRTPSISASVAVTPVTLRLLTENQPPAPSVLLGIAVAALLVIEGQLGMGAMVAGNLLMSNALRPMSTLVATWKQMVDARKAYRRLETLMSEWPPRPAAAAAV